MSKRKLSKIPEIKISASDLAPICGMDHYGNWARVMAKIWKQYDLTDYRVWESRAKLSGKPLATDRPLTQISTLSDNATANNRPIAAALIKSIKSSVLDLNKDKAKSSAELIVKQTELHNMVSANTELTPDEKQQLIDLMKTATNTHHGITNEVNGYKIFTECMGKPCTSQQKTMKMVILENSVNNFEGDNTLDYQWVLTGRLDGLTADGEVVEIKNRTKGLFREIRDYEHVQLQAYIHMMGATCGHLLELHRLGDGRMDYDIKSINAEPGFITDFITGWFQRVRNFITQVLPMRDDLKLAIMTGNSSVSQGNYY